MRIRRFSEARGIFEEEVSFEPQIHCFGGGGDNGGGGNDSDTGGDYNEDDFADDSGFTEGFGGGGAGDQAVSDVSPGGGGGGGDNNDNDSDGIPNTIDATPGAPTSPFSSPVAPGESTDRGIADVGRAYDEAVGSIAAGIDAFGPGGAAGRDAPLGGSAGDFDGVSFSGPSLTESLNDIDLGFDDGDVGTDNVAFAAPGFAPPNFTAEPEFIQPGGPGTRGLDIAVGEKAARGVDAAQDYMDYMQATNRERLASGGTRDLSTTIDPSNQLDPFGDGFMTDAERAALDAQIAADNARISALTQALSTPAPSVGPGQTVSSVEMQNRLADQVGTSGSFSTRPSVTDPNRSILSIGGREYSFDNTVPADQRSYTEISGPSIGGVTGALDIDVFDEQPADITITGGEPAFSFTRDVLGVDQSIPQMSLAPESRPSQFDRQARMGEVQGPMSMAPVDQTRFSGQDMMRQADDVLAERAIDEAIFEDPSSMPLMTVRAGMEVVNALESTFGGNQARKIADVANRPGGALVRDPRSGEVLGAVGPEENIRSAFMGAQDAVYVGDPRGYEQGVDVGTSILGPDTNVRAVPTQDPFGGGMEGEPGADYSQPPEAQREGGDDRQPPEVVPPDPETKVCPIGYSPDGNGNCVYQGRDVVGTTPYTPMGPVNISYTGLPSLAPRTLRPTSPNLDFLTRSQTAQPGSYSGLGSLRRN